ncbi:Transcriptional regulator, GntR family [Pseudonocardia sp. Ae406_Ps2]|uniref:GntR family transcriptional regulator n=1 Tax=unclassified Pseudonocardia TaxID=2619320 RepID=UPI00094ADC92|nr:MULTISPECIES: GntR family transcriptional regulator [unclassified Pseudonocardia]OLL98251.1 Transcriptional regulator, GntR family [Pseudonocardia sp. Ae331_Ps2]OLM04038.1 Transcriptional regulator, GntR family [Pseudonocardia sp. Ae406_Ps2]OLM25586.1 Transcriptional regulator, GntR family [Pseudonocardia sp. Ae706_Ps2]OLM34252.1 Transcriptional regulator, GntR family [Pseudonocardia sp. Ae717_Ps2]
MTGAHRNSSAPSARERVYLYLRQQITTGEYGPGIRLVEEQIAEELGVSRTPIREALQRLTSEGLVERVRRGQLVVVRIDDTARAELHELRIAFDQVAASLLTQKVGSVDWESLHALLDPLGHAAREYGIGSPQYGIAHLDLHVAINRAAFSPVTSAFLERQAFLHPTDDYVQQSGHEPVAQHRDLLDDLASGDLDRAQTAMRVHALRGHGNTTLS